MATPHGEPKPSRIIGSISKLAGAFVGNAVVTGKRVISSVTPLSEELSGKQRKKTIKAPAKKKKKEVRKAGTKVPKTKKKKKKVIKRTGSSGKSRVSKKKATKSSAKKTKKTKKAKKKKGTTYRKKTAAKKEKYNRPQDGLISEIGAGEGVPIEEQEPQVQPSTVSSEPDIEQDANTFGAV